MKTKVFFIVILGIAAIWLGIDAFGIGASKSAHCIPREGEMYCIAHAGTWPTFNAEKPRKYSFFVIDKNGKTVKDFATVHEKLLHLIVVRKDLGAFQHLHPELDTKTGEFTLNDLTLPTDGAYRIFADFTQTGKEKAVTYEDVAAGDSHAYPATERLVPKTESEADGYVVHLTADPAIQSGAMARLAFTITKNGTPVTDLEPYLGAYAHAVIIRNGTLEYLHVHPQTDGHDHAASLFAPTAYAHGLDQIQTGTISLMTTFPFGGDYKLFFQIKHAGAVHTFDFILPVLQGAAGDHGEEMHM